MCLLQNGLPLGVWSEEDGSKIRIRRQQISAVFDIEWENQHTKLQSKWQMHQQQAHIWHTILLLLCSPVSNCTGEGGKLMIFKFFTKEIIEH